MVILSVDTSSKYMSLTVSDNGRAIAAFHRVMDQRQCEQLLPQIDKLLKKAKLKLKDIGCIAFSKGPGSLTALRIGAATVKGLALAAKIKIIGVPTLDALAYNIKEEGSLVVPVVDARRGNVYASAYSFRSGKLRQHLKYSVGPVAELLKSVKGDAVFLGDGLVAYRKTIEDNFRHKAGFATEKLWYPRAETVAYLAYELAKKKKFEEADKFVPMYLYPKDVQVRNLKK
ncbi:MAG: tRNA (adenosine(37)-N6)-threonylcarbamoyltransferase complex dimerization subunit type 1 TsaB [Candidatus Omnitrophica bacterium]|nr:tRNA (adenosine(37)-N6)-threonylcarbamoyltransferase complex dimerization subunit type 1 TsaB [Candidatus Omnitrophota bacterium]